jgi:ferredoxin-NADP reductase
MRERLGRIRAIQEIADGVLAIDVVAVEPATLRFLPGQFVSMSVGERGRRSFSVASAPDRKDGFDLIVKPGGTGATQEFIRNLRVNHEVRFFGPMGYFLYDAGRHDAVVFAATGVGISAIWSMVLASIRDPGPKSLRLFWGNRTEKDVFYRQQLQALAEADPRFQFDIRISQAANDYITPHVLATAQTQTPPVYYLCGNGAMISTLSAALSDAGIPADDIRTEAFYG